MKIGKISEWIWTKMRQTDDKRPVLLRGRDRLKHLLRFSGYANDKDNILFPAMIRII